MSRSVKYIQIVANWVEKVISSMTTRGHNESRYNL
jgi:hypothetical protein